MKFFKYLLYALLAVSAVLLVMFFVQGGDGEYALENLAAIQTSTTMVDGIIWWTYALVALAIVLVIVLSIWGLAKNPKSLKRAAIFLVLAIVICGGSYFLASGDIVAVNVDKVPSADTFKLTDTILNITYVLFAGAIISIIAGGVIKMIRNR